jgi:hypothetical protein
LENSNNNNFDFPIKPLNERVAVLETKFEDFDTKLETIGKKLDDLLTLKAQGMGALGLVSLLVGSGLVGILITVIQFFNRPHI